MHNCHRDVLAYHDEKVTLPEAERRDMRDRRDANRNRLNAGLKRDDAPSLLKSESQGSYVHRTMVQQPDKDYDVDDGAYFAASDLIKANGKERTPREVKEMVRAAVHSESFKTTPEVRRNCVRVYYDAGYHVDIPGYRDVVDGFGQHIRYDLAGPIWKESDPTAVTAWFLQANKSKSPDETNGRQLRRQVRLLKAFARSRKSWRDQIATGFMITTLIVDECYRADAQGEDRALYDTMRAIRDRLYVSLQIVHPVVPGDELTKGPDDSKTRFLRDKLDWALAKLAVVQDPRCTRAEALDAWDQVFDTEFFSNRDGGSKGGNSRGGPAIVSIRNTGAPPRDPFEKRGGGRYG